MSIRYAETMLDTHEVTNQPPPFTGFNAYDTDRALVEGVRREGAGCAHGILLPPGECADGGHRADGDAVHRHAAHV